MKRLTIFLLFVLLLVACATGAEPQAEAPQAAAGEVAQNENAESEATTAVQPTTEPPTPRLTEEQAAELSEVQAESPIVEETAAEPETESTAPTPEVETADSPTEEPPAPEATGPVVISGRTEEGAFFLGDVHAPVTLIDYSDFL